MAFPEYPLTVNLYLSDASDILKVLKGINSSHCAFTENRRKFFINLDLT